MLAAQETVNSSLNAEEERLEERYWDNEIYYWRNYSYNWEERDNPCHQAYYNEDRIASTHLLGSDLGLIVKKGNNRSYHFAATNLLTAMPEANTKIKLYNFQQQLLGEVTTDASGFGIYDGEKSFGVCCSRKKQQFRLCQVNGWQCAFPEQI